MTIQVVTLSIQELQGIINTERENAYSSGYLKAKKELEQIAKPEPVFPELLNGVKELNRYLAFKGYWSGSVNTLNKKTTQLLILGEKQGKRLIFRKGEIDHAFVNGFSFEPIPKKHT